MKSIFKTILINTLLIANFSCAQTTLKSVENARIMEKNKKEFVGKNLNYFLKHINLDIKSIIPTPNKNLKEVNRISFLFVSSKEYKNSNREISEKPTRITVVFNQNSDLLGDRCRYDIDGCTQWTKKDEKTLGDLIVYDIYVTGKN